MTVALKAILDSHNTPTLKKFIRDSNLSVGTLKRGELIALMIKNKERFGHIKPDESRYKRGKEKPTKVEGRGRGRPRKKPAATGGAKPAGKRPTIATPLNLTPLNRFPKWTPRTPATPLRTPATPALKTPKTARKRNPLLDVQMRSYF
tara:strand:- start:2018 stop:2461 length:444 start_codon:yes stop_codon:yes gene_type:complete